MDSPRFLTLTIASGDEPLAELLKTLRTAFGKLRRSAFWKAHFSGGVYTIEVTRNAKTGAWHPHIHAICDGVYTPQAELQSQWSAAVGSLAILDIRALYGRAKAAAYLAKYATKTGEIASWPREAICEAALALHGERLMSTFGSLHGMKLDTRDPNDDPGASGPLVTLVSLDYALLDDTPGVSERIKAIARVCPALCRWFPDHAPPIDYKPDPDDEDAAVEACWGLRLIIDDTQFSGTPRW